MRIVTLVLAATLVAACTKHEVTRSSGHQVTGLASAVPGSHGPEVPGGSAAAASGAEVASLSSVPRSQGPEVPGGSASSVSAVAGSNAEVTGSRGHEVTGPARGMADGTSTRREPSPAGHVAGGAESKRGDAKRPPVDGVVVAVVETVPFTYLRLRTARGEGWVAAENVHVPLGARVNVAATSAAMDVEVKSLGRTFDAVVFGRVTGPDVKILRETSVASGEELPAKHQRWDRPVTAPAAVRNVSASGSEYTVAEVWSRRAALAGKPVVLRGRVTKFLPNIMGANWIHLSDGTGSRNTRDNDLVIVTSAVVPVGATVTVTGVVRIDRDFAIGIRYPVILEEAEVRP